MCPTSRGAQRGSVVPGKAVTGLFSLHMAPHWCWVCSCCCWLLLNRPSTRRHFLQKAGENRAAEGREAGRHPPPGTRGWYFHTQCSLPGPSLSPRVWKLSFSICKDKTAMALHRASLLCLSRLPVCLSLSPSSSFSSFSFYSLTAVKQPLPLCSQITSIEDTLPLPSSSLLPPPAS